MSPTDLLRTRIEAEYRQLPRLRLTLPQVALLFGSDPNTCRRVLDGLIAVGVLRHTPTGHFVALPNASGQLKASLTSALHLAPERTPDAESWLFTRNAASVRLVRVAEPDGRMRLTVEGPGTLSTTSYTLSFPQCLQRQSEIERMLMAEGFQLRRIGAERRSGRERRQQARGRDRRRIA